MSVWLARLVVRWYRGTRVPPAPTAPDRSPGFPWKRGDFGCGDQPGRGWPSCARCRVGQVCGLPLSCSQGPQRSPGLGRPAGPPPEGRLEARGAVPYP